MITLPPFKSFLASNIPSVYDNTLSYYDELTKLIAYLEQQVVPAINKNAEDIAKYEGGLEQLKEYVDHYFDNLDVQQEINNKLDAMAEGGELAEIVALYANLPCIHAYDTIADMAASESLVAGSFARAMSKTVAGTGDGNYYKIRETVGGDNPDGVNLVTITGTTLVAEIIPDAFMDVIAHDLQEVEAEIDNKYNRTDNISLQNYLMYDMNKTYYSQGSTIDENGTVYVYKSNTSYNGGDVLVFDKTTETLTNTITTNFYHGNALLKKGNYLYAAACNNTDNTFIKYDLGTGTAVANTTLNAETAYANCISVSDFDTDKIMITLGQPGYNANVMSVAPYIFDLTDNSYTKITLTNSKNYNIGMFYATQTLTYKNGHIYALMSQPNCILDFKLDGTTADLQKIYQVPRRDLLGLLVGEVEQLSPVPGTDYFLLTTHCDDNQKGTLRTIKMYFLGFETELPQLYHARQLTDTQCYMDHLYLDNSKTSLYEDGSSTYPFKTLARACESASHSEMFIGNHVEIKSGTYEFGRLNNVNVVLALTDNTTVVNFQNAGESEISASKLNFILNDGRINILEATAGTKQLVIDDHSDVKFRGGVHFYETLRVTDESDVTVELGYAHFSGKSYSLQATQGSRLNFNISTSGSEYPNNPLFVLSSNAVLITNQVDQTQTYQIDGRDCWTKIMYGLHSADS